MSDHIHEESLGYQHRRRHLGEAAESLTNDDDDDDDEMCDDDDDEGGANQHEDQQILTDRCITLKVMQPLQNDEHDFSINDNNYHKLS